MTIEARALGLEPVLLLHPKLVPIRVSHFLREVALVAWLGINVGGIAGSAGCSDF